VNKKFYFFIIFLFITNCSLDTKSGIWSQSKDIVSENKNKKEKLFKKAEIYEEEFNTDLKIRLKGDLEKKNSNKNLLNNTGIVKFNGQLKKISKYKFSKIDKFYQYQPELLITKENTLIFFNDKGTVLNFAKNNKLVWKNNVYSKFEKKQKPILYFASNDKILIVTDNLARYYAINVDTGKTIWSKSNIAPFNSQVKIFKDKFFAIDFENVLRCFSIKDGNEIWNFKTEKSFIKSQQKLSFIINNNKIVFINTLGDLTSVDIETGNLVWQTPTQSSTIIENYFSLKNSDLISANNLIFFSNNQNEFFAIDENNGGINWIQNLNSNLRPTFVDGLVFTVTLEGYLVAIDSRNGNIVRMTNVLSIINNYKKKNIKPEGFIISNDKIFLSLNNGRLVVIETLTGKPTDVVKIDSQKISRPYILNNEMFIVRDNAIIKLN
tara:strand:+ start:1165 stop:2472 length:1308 start_codon:yes stop_codon:yes gene_type:complete